MDPNFRVVTGDPLKTLQKVHSTAVSLIDYVRKIADCDEAHVISEGDSVEYLTFLTTTAIVPAERRNGVGALFKITDDSLRSSRVRDFLNLFVAYMVKSNLPYRDQNCLTYGYRSKSSFTECGMRSHVGLECYFVNTLHNIVTSPMWQKFSSRVGEEVLRHIMMRPVFMQCTSTKSCYIQVAGTYPRYSPKYAVKNVLNENLSCVSNDKSLKAAEVTDLSTSSRYQLQSKHSSTVCPVTSCFPGHGAGPPRLSNSSLTATAARNQQHTPTLDIPKITSGCAQFNRHKIFYNTRRENKVGLPSKHILGQQESLATTSKLYHDIFQMSDSQQFEGSPILTVFVEGIQKRFLSCSVLKHLAKHCPIESIGNKKRKNINARSNKIQTASSYGDGVGCGEVDEGDGEEVLHSAGYDGFNKLNCLTEPITAAPNNPNGQSHGHGPSSSTVGSYMCDESILGRLPIRRDINTVTVEKVNIPCYKKTKRGCRGGQGNRIFSNSSSNGNKNTHKSDKKRKHSAVSGNTETVKINSSQNIAKVVTFAGKTLDPADSRTPYKSCSSCSMRKDSYPVGVMRSYCCDDEQGDKVKDTSLNIPVQNTLNCGSKSGGFGLHVSGTISSTFLPASNTAMSKTSPLTRHAAKRRCTVGDRLLSRMRCNTKQDITLSLSSKRPKVAPTLSDDNRIDGGYISQEDTVRRSSRLSYTNVRTSAPLCGVMCFDPPKGTNREMPTDPRPRESRHGNHDGDHDDDDDDDDGDGDGGCDFTYDVDSIGRDQCDANISVGGMGNERDRDCCDVEALHDRKCVSTAEPYNTSTQHHVSHGPLPLYVDGGESNTQATESVSSAEWLQNMKVLSSRTDGSGLSHHINSRALTTEMSQISTPDNLFPVDLGSAAWNLNMQKPQIAKSKVAESVRVPYNWTESSSTRVSMNVNSAYISDVLDQSTPAEGGMNVRPQSYPAVDSPTTPHSSSHIIRAEMSGSEVGMGLGKKRKLRDVLNDSDESLLPVSSECNPNRRYTSSFDGHVAQGCSPSNPIPQHCISDHLPDSSFIPLNTSPSPSLPQSPYPFFSSPISFSTSPSIPHRTPSSNLKCTSRSATHAPHPAPPLPLPLSPMIPTDLRSMCCPLSSVCQFVKSVCLKVFPLKSVWGNRRNLSGFLAAIDRYVRLGRSENITLSQATLKIKVGIIPWLHTGVTKMTPKRSSKKSTLRKGNCSTGGGDIGAKSNSSVCAASSSSYSNLSTATETAANTNTNTQQQVYVGMSAGMRSEVFNRFYTWLFESFVSPLISSSFYVTEAEGRGADVLYYRKGVWNGILKQARTQMGSHFMDIATDQTYSKENAENSSGPKVFSTARNGLQRHSAVNRNGNILNLKAAPCVRFIPKKSSVRPITNLKSNHRAGQRKRSMSINGVENGIVTNGALYNCLHVLKHKYSMNPSLAGFGSFGLDELYLKFRRYRKRMEGGEGGADEGVNVNALPTILSAGKTTSAESRSKLHPSTAASSSLLNSAIRNTEIPPTPISAVPGPSEHFQFQNAPEGKIGCSVDPGSDSETRTEVPPKYYVAVLDLEKCYDNVDTSLLYDLVVKLLNNGRTEEVDSPVDCPGADNVRTVQGKGSTISNSDVFNRYTSGKSGSDRGRESGSDDGNSDDDDGYLVHRYSVSHYISSMERVVTKPVRFIADAGDLTPFKIASEEIARHYRNSVITDGVVYAKMTHADILRLVRTHLFAHVVRMPFGAKHGSYYTQVRGIPQGSILSPLLCNLYYGEAERQIFGSDKEVRLLGLEDSTLIMRLMDDYLVVSTDKAAVQHFLQRAHQALKPFGGGVNPLKTKVNFDSEIEMGGARITLARLPSSSLHWCGFEVDTVTLEVKPSFARIFESPLPSSITVECAHTGVALRHAMKSFVRMKCHAIVLDRNLNSYSTVLRTIYRTFLVAAMRTHCYVSASRSARRGNVSSAYLSSCIYDAVQFGGRLVHSRTRDKQPRVIRLGERGAGHRVRPLSLFTKCVSLLYPEHSAKNGGTSGNANATECISGTDKTRTSSCEISFTKAVWLGLKGFQSALGRKPSSYHKTLMFLRKKIRIVEEKLLTPDQDSSLGLMFCSGERACLEHDNEILKDCSDCLEDVSWL